MTDLIVIRAAFVVIFVAVSIATRPFQLGPLLAAANGVAVALLILLLEMRLRQVNVTRLVGAAIGSVIGIIAALLISTVIAQAAPAASPTVGFVQIAILALATYVGVVVGYAKADAINLSALGGLVDGHAAESETFNILDTSVVIDGRIGDIAETGFLDGALAIPQFVLRELQLVADSADSLKRNRGRRGLDVLQRLQTMPQLRVRILDDDFPHIREVDMKLVELGKKYGCKIVTNDFNLNKVAQVHGVEVLNINELANALKPVVLPGEIMRVFVLKEGKEYNQGVAYLDDGTMVVVDNARRYISKTIDITVTSVLQTTAGKMIFGKFDERQHAVHDKAHASDRQSVSREQPSSAGAQV